MKHRSTHRTRASAGRKYILLSFLSIAASAAGLTPYVISAQPPGTKKPAVQIRFSESTAQEPPKGSDGKLTSDIDRSNTKPGDAKQSPALSPIGIATDEERNQKIAVDWKKPWAVLYVTGKQYGYMEPCGCTGLENQKGGLNRRDTLLQLIRKRGWDVVAIDGGNQVQRQGRQAEIKFQWTATALREMDYAATTFGKDDLMLTWDSIYSATLDNSGKNNLFVSANVSMIPDSDLPYRSVAVGNRKIGITGVLGDELAKSIKNELITIESAVPALQKVSKKMASEKFDFTVLIAQTSLEDTRALAKAVPAFDLIVTAGGFGEPTYRPEKVPGTKTQIVQVGVKGMYAGIVGLFDDAKEPTRYQRIALSSQFEDSPRIMQLFGRYQDELKANSANNFQTLGLRPVIHPSTREFVGSEKCGECHTTAFDKWRETGHANATESIVEPPQRSMARHFDPECLSCHVTGWNPQKIYPYRTGYETLEKTPHMLGNGCENCHGPGSQHTAAETGELEADAELMNKLREEMRLPLARAEEKCIECHDGDNSPEFHKPGAFQEYWEKIKHYGKD